MVVNVEKIYAQKTIAYIITCMQMKRSVRTPVFILLCLIVVATTLGCRVAIRSGFGSVYGNGYGGTHIWGTGSVQVRPLDLPLFNSTLLRLAEVELGEAKMRMEVDQLLEGDFRNPAKFRTFATWRRFFSIGVGAGGASIGARTSRGYPVGARLPEFNKVWKEFRRCLSDWARKKRFEPEILEELVEQVKVTIDRHYGVLRGGENRKYSSCAVVGNSGILLSKEYGELIDSHEVVIRLNNARISSYQKNVGAKTSMSFVNSNILHLCARREDCRCHPYGANVPIIMYMCQPAQFLDFVVCSSSHKSPLIVTDPRFDKLCSRIVKYYSLKRIADARNKTFEEWNTAHDGSLFHYSSGMQAVMLAMGICDRVSLFGFGKTTGAKHHYHTNQKAELRLHDYLAEYDFYQDLMEKPWAVPFISIKFEFPPVVIYH